MDTFNGGVTIPLDRWEMLSVWKASKYKGGHEYFVDSMETGHNLEHAVSYYFSIAKKQISSLPLKVISERSVSLFLFERKILLCFSIIPTISAFLHHSNFG